MNEDLAIPGFIVALERSWPLLLSGLARTLEAGVYSILIGTFVGLALGLMLTYAGRLARLSIRVYVDVARGIPGLVAIFTFYYFINQALRSLTGIEMSPMTAGVLALAFHASAQVAEMTRGAIQSLPAGQAEAGKSIGLTFLQTQFYVIFPQAIRQILPTWVTSAGEIVKGTALLSLISVPELFVATKEVATREYMYFEFYVLTMLIYFVIIYGIEVLGHRLESRFNTY